MAKAGSGKQTGRRKFLKSVALGAGAMALPEAASAASKPAQEPSPAPRRAANREPATRSFAYPRVYRGRQLAMISFPLGGIGAGSIGLGGRGQLRDWEIFNRPDHGNSPAYAFAAVHTEDAKGSTATKVLESRILPPYEGPSGLGSNNVPGLPRLASAVFHGEFPLAGIEFRDPDLPVRLSLEAFTPFFPIDAEESGLPAAVIRYRALNTTSSPVKVSIALAIENPVGDHGRTNEFREGAEGAVKALLMRNPMLAARNPLAGSFVLGCLAHGSAAVTHLRGWAQAQWWESAWLYWKDFAADGALGPEAAQRNTVGSLCLQRTLAARQPADFTFLLAWHFPNRTPGRCGWSAPKGHEDDVIGNHYASRFKDAWEVARHVSQNLDALEKNTRLFILSMRQTTLPAEVKDAAQANLATLVSPTTFRTSDGAFHGFEGVNDHQGCCFGSCTHVWNYETVTQHLFPALARSLREQQFGYSLEENGLMNFRQLLPDGLDHWGTAAADGQMGTLIKLYLDWRMSGDDEWLRKMWPYAQRALSYAWLPGGWDENRDGVMEGVQHNTYDVEFIGPNPLCGVWYLGALRACEQMARAVGDAKSADDYQVLFEHGSQWLDAHLFNGEYYVQQVRTADPDKLAPGVRAPWSAVDPAHPQFQLGEGCLVDQLVGQYMAHAAGLGRLLGMTNIRKTLDSIYRYNYKRSMVNHAAVQRTFALNNEAALVICDYPHGKEPEAPFPYFAEVMTGFEYSAAILMMYEEQVGRGVELIGNIRQRYDGERRNPWNEAECGFHYARAMAAWQAIPALSGFFYDAPSATVTLRPRVTSAQFSSLWSAGQGWGVFNQSAGEKQMSGSLRVHGGGISCRHLALPAYPQARTSRIMVNGESRKHTLRHTSSTTEIEMAETAQIGAGSWLRFHVVA